MINLNKILKCQNINRLRQKDSKFEASLGYIHSKFMANLGHKGDCISNK
jgi:hypothetical protein